MKNLKSSLSDSNRPAFALRLSVCVLLATLLGGANAQTRIQTKHKDSNRPQKTNSGGTVTPPGGGPAVHGSGTAGMIPKWLDSSSIGDSIMSEASGKIGIGTPSPGSKLSVVGMIETTLGGYKFPDGTVQTTAAAGGLGSVAHDSTLTGNGTTGSPLGVAVPLNLTGAIPNTEVISVINTAPGRGITVNGGNSDGAVIGGTGVFASGGNGNSFQRAGDGVFGNGGSSDSADAVPGSGVNGIGGSNPQKGGAGLSGLGGTGGTPAFRGIGGDGVVATGGIGRGSGGAAGTGILAAGGFGLDDAVDGPAGSFFGDVFVRGNFSVTAGHTKNFKIDHPLDPENKYLYHAAIESSEVLNVYSGNVTTDSNGDAIVELPAWFEAINRDFRYQLTVVGQFAQAIVANEIKDNRFTIKTNASNVKVSWQVTGVRSDPGAIQVGFKVEEDKPEHERGTYLNPAAYNQAEEKSAEWARNPELMKMMKQRREEVEKTRPSQQGKADNR